VLAPDISGAEEATAAEVVVTASFVTGAIIPVDGGWAARLA